MDTAAFPPAPPPCASLAGSLLPAAAELRAFALGAAHALGLAPRVETRGPPVAVALRCANGAYLRLGPAADDAGDGPAERPPVAGDAPTMDAAAAARLVATVNGVALHLKLTLCGSDGRMLCAAPGGGVALMALSHDGAAPPDAARWRILPGAAPGSVRLQCRGGGFLRCGVAGDVAANGSGYERSALFWLLDPAAEARRVRAHRASRAQPPPADGGGGGGGDDARAATAARVAAEADAAAAAAAAMAAEGRAEAARVAERAARARLAAAAPAGGGRAAAAAPPSPPPPPPPQPPPQPPHAAVETAAEGANDEAETDTAVGIDEPAGPPPPGAPRAAASARGHEEGGAAAAAAQPLPPPSPPATAAAPPQPGGLATAGVADEAAAVAAESAGGCGGAGAGTGGPPPPQPPPFCDEPCDASDDEGWVLAPAPPRRGHE